MKTINRLPFWQGFWLRLQLYQKVPWVTNFKSDTESVDTSDDFVT
jgi:hypothetical protein